MLIVNLENVISTRLESFLKQNYYISSDNWFVYVIDILKNVVSPYLRILKDGMKEEVIQSFKVTIRKSRVDIFMNPPCSCLYCKLCETVLKYFALIGFFSFHVFIRQTNTNFKLFVLKSWLQLTSGDWQWFALKGIS